MPSPASAQAVLYGTTANGTLFTVNLATGVGTPIGTLPSFGERPGSTEIVVDSSGHAWTQGRDGAFAIQRFDLANAAGIGSQVDDGASFSGLQYIGGTLYGTAVEDSGDPSTLRTLDPTTGASTTIGPTGVGPISGLAYNGTTLYGISGGGGERNALQAAAIGGSQLYTINLTTGAATLVGGTGIRAGGLAFGPDGNLYAGGAGPNAGMLYRLDPATGEATPVGDTGMSTGLNDGISGLMTAVPPVPTPTPTPGAVPLPPSALLVLTGVAGLGLHRARRYFGRKQ